MLSDTCKAEPKGEVLRGKLQDIKHQRLALNGQRPHAAGSFEGTRISIVYFASRHAQRMTAERRLRVQRVGFPRSDHLPQVAQPLQPAPDPANSRESGSEQSMNVEVANEAER